jgi:hypothetical protein
MGAFRNLDFVAILMALVGVSSLSNEVRAETSSMGTEPKATLRIAQQLPRGTPAPARPPAAAPAAPTDSTPQRTETTPGR